MFPRTLLALGLLIGAGVALSQSALAEVAVDAALMKVLDPDADGTVDLKEAQAAGATVFKSTPTTTARSTPKSSRVASTRPS